jgi:hypothetical protein
MKHKVLEILVKRRKEAKRMALKFEEAYEMVKSISHIIHILD